MIHNILNVYLFSWFFITVVFHAVIFDTVITYKNLKRKCEDVNYMFFFSSMSFSILWIIELRKPITPGNYLIPSSRFLNIW